jgi:hypothetical protein
VIFKAGLEGLNSRDPFSGKDEQDRQAINSLAAIEHTIRRNPEVLFVVPSSQENDPKSTLPLYMWLVPKLLALTAYSKNDGFRDGVMRLLKTALVAERKVHIRQVRFDTVLRYVKGCTKG